MSNVIVVGGGAAGDDGGSFRCKKWSECSVA